MKLLLPLISLFLPKLKEREKNWKTVFDGTNIKMNPGDKLVWFHAASMGEFEQAKQIIEDLKSENIKILVTFYSPSGYLHQKDYPFADAVLYLPADTNSNVKMFLNKFNPDLCVFVRYEIWHNYLHQCAKRNIPAFLIAATKPQKSKLISFEPVKQFYALNYSYFDKIYTVGNRHSDFFKSLDIKSEIITATDPRFDRIKAAVEKNRKQEIINREIFGNEFVLVAGSTWPPDEDILVPALERLNKNNFKYRCIFVPHEPTEEHLERLTGKTNSILLSELTDMLSKEKDPYKIREALGGKHIITDTIGKLLSLYGVADAAYIGGAFGVGVHSVTEPAGYCLPLATGPKINNSPDAPELLKAGSLTIVRDDSEVEKWLTEISNEETHAQQSKISEEYIKSRLGTSDIIIREIKKALQLN
jgi:3-deoxy-D-manno-octulosonic-acid transferase